MCCWTALIHPTAQNQLHYILVILIMFSNYSLMRPDTYVSYNSTRIQVVYTFNYTHISLFNLLCCLSCSHICPSGGLTQIYTNTLSTIWMLHSLGVDWYDFSKPKYCQNFHLQFTPQPPWKRPGKRQKKSAQRQEGERTVKTPRITIIMQNTQCRVKTRERKTDDRAGGVNR